MSHDVWDRRYARTVAGKTIDELQAMRLAIEADEDNRNPPGSFFIFTKKARAKLNVLAMAIQQQCKAAL